MYCSVLVPESDFAMAAHSIIYTHTHIHMPVEAAFMQGTAYSIGSILGLRVKTYCPKDKHSKVQTSSFARLKFPRSKRTSEGSVSSTRMFGPVVSGPKAQMDLAASKSQSYLVWKNSPSFFLQRAEWRRLSEGERQRARDSQKH